MEQMTTGRNMELVMLMKKIEIRLSCEQVKSLVILMTHYSYHQPIVTLGDKSNVFLIQQIYEKKIRRWRHSLKSEFKLSLDIVQATALFQMFASLGLADYPYELNLCNYITGEINHQTI